MIADDTPFLAAIRAAPDDDAPRLVYADWLDEHGQSARAEFIRVQCLLARRKSAELRAREAELLARHHDAFAAHLAAPGLRFTFERGFIVAFGHSGVFVDRNKRTDVMYLLRFYPDGLVITDATGIQPVEEVLPEFHRGNSRDRSARYTMNWDARPAGVLFSTVSEDTGYQIDYRGVFKKTFLHIEMGSPGEKWHRPRRYKLEPVAGFDSFADL
jgi:uncharacterized protein (TIGR02996 family)